MRSLMALAAAALCACAPLTQPMVSLDGAGTDDVAAVAVIDNDTAHPALLRGLDGRALDAVRVPSALWNGAFVVKPGEHVLWVSSVPYGHPLMPQFIRCFVIEASLDAGARYTLQYDPAHEQARLLRQGSTDAGFIGRLVDKPFMLERSCRWP